MLISDQHHNITNVSWNTTLSLHPDLEPKCLTIVCQICCELMRIIVDDESENEFHTYCIEMFYVDLLNEAFV